MATLTADRVAAVLRRGASARVDAARAAPARFAVGQHVRVPRRGAAALVNSRRDRRAQPISLVQESDNSLYHCIRNQLQTVFERVGRGMPPTNRLEYSQGFLLFEKLVVLHWTAAAIG